MRNLLKFSNNDDGYYNEIRRLIPLPFGNYSVSRIFVEKPSKFICVHTIISVYNDQHYDQHVTAAQIYGSRRGQRYIETGSLYKLFFDGNTKST